MATRQVEPEPHIETGLSEWLRENERSARWFAKVVGVNYQTALSWIYGRKVPTIVCGARIERATDGHVPIVSWLALPAAKEAWDEMVKRAEETKKHPGLVMGRKGRRAGIKYG